MADALELTGPNLREEGVLRAGLDEAVPLLGHAGGEPVLLVCRGGDWLAVSATCTHYGGPLAEGRVVGETVRCPWHHACFDLRTGAPSAPALTPLACWKVEQRAGRLFVTEKVAPLPRPRRRPAAQGLERVVVIGGGAAGHSTADTLRREGYGGGLVLLSADAEPPYDRPNASKDYLAGSAPEAWMPLRSLEHYAERGIELRLGQRVTGLDASARRAHLSTGESLPFDGLILATGAEPIRLNLPGAQLPHVRYLRSWADSRAIIACCAEARRVVVLGASFIGLEVAAALRARGLEVHVVSPARPLESVLGPALSAFVQRLHEAHGVSFHLGLTAAAIERNRVTLSDGTVVPAELVVVGIGVRPSLELAERAGLALDRGVAVDEYLQTSAPGIYAAGDIARWPDAHTGRRLRVEHWVVAQRQGAAAARNLLGQRQPFAEVPFFWSQHYDVTIRYVGHAERWERAELSGSLDERSAVVAYREGGRIAAVATVGREHTSLDAEDALSRDDQPSLERLLHPTDVVELNEPSASLPGAH